MQVCPDQEAEQRCQRQNSHEAHNVCLGVVDDKTVLGLGVALERMSTFAEINGTATSFHGIHVPSMGIRDYILRVRKYLRCSTECFVLAMIYIDRLIKRHPYVTVDRLSCHRLAICAMTLAAKFQDDEFYTNSFYAKVGGIQLEEINALEVKMLQLLDYRLHVSPAEFEGYRHVLNEAAEGDFEDDNMKC